MYTNNGSRTRSPAPQNISDDISNGDNEPLLDVLALLREVNIDGAVSKRNANGIIEKMGTDVVGIMDEKWEYKYFRVALMGYVPKAESNNTLELAEHVAEMCRNFLGEGTPHINIKWVYIGERKPNRSAELAYEAPVYIDIQE